MGSSSTSSKLPASAARRAGGALRNNPTRSACANNLVATPGAKGGRANNVACGRQPGSMGRPASCTSNAAIKSELPAQTKCVGRNAHFLPKSSKDLRAPTGTSSALRKPPR
mmetsp:Transcript_11094/g.30428  ORF Transcript_11094/g.30428 Transcript_11094/m.30428 type:complete len:111 (+) Transcript_11094:142-474(+)